MNTDSRLRRLVLVIFIAGTFAVIAPLGAAARTWEDDPGSPATLSDASVAHLLVEAVFNGGDADAAAFLVADDAVIHTRLGDYTGSQGLLDYIASLRHTYPGASFDFLRATVSGNGVTTIDWLMTSTKIRMGSSEEVTSVDIALRESIAITTDDGHITSATFDPNTAVASVPIKGGLVVTDCLAFANCIIR
jgi:predicted SnoaL-like aldol condensation-catalyzing enzyme